MKNLYAIKIYAFMAFLFTAVWTQAQSYAPQAGLEGTTAIHQDSAVFVGWASGVEITRGYQDIAAGNDYASVGDESSAIGKASHSVVSLGDAGVATLTFDKPIQNGSGYDFAVFENGFLQAGSDSLAFLELAFVEVSSNGVDFFRFPSVNEYDEDYIATYSGPGGAGFATMDARYLHNVAGTYIKGYGTPFDLDDIPEDPKLDKDQITHVRIIDVVGDNGNFATYDSQGNKMIDPYPTPFGSSGFDLNAVGVIHEGTLAVEHFNTTEVSVYPTHVKDWLNVSANNFNYQLYNTQGQLVQYGSHVSKGFNVRLLNAGAYFLTLQLTNGEVQNFKIFKK